LWFEVYSPWFIVHSINSERRGEKLKVKRLEVRGWRQKALIWGGGIFGIANCKLQIAN
jgi:hypothetical protein